MMKKMVLVSIVLALAATLVFSGYTQAQASFPSFEKKSVTVTQPGTHAFDAFLKISSIDGDSSDSKHRNWTDIISYEHGMSHGNGIVTQTLGPTTHETFKVVKTVDKASPILMLAVNSGQHFQQVTLELDNAGTGQKFMEYKLSDVIVSSVNVIGSSNDGMPLEEVGFSYRKIEWKFTPKTGNTTVSTGWDLAENTHT